VCGSRCKTEIEEAGELPDQGERIQGGCARVEGALQLYR